MRQHPEPEREPVRRALSEYFKQKHAPQPFKPGETYITVAGRNYDEADMQAALEGVLDFWLTGGRFTESFEQGLAKCFDRPAALFVNSGSSANLLAVASLCARALGPKRLLPGDEVITVAAGFPTTVAPLLQHGLVPVLVDVECGTYNTTPERIERAIGPKTRAIMIAHTLGNPFRADQVAKLAQERDLFLIEDCCDALGSTIGAKPVGSFGELATVSFYPAHHITTGEGGALAVKDAKWKRIAESLRDWGRDCWCPTGHDNTCRKRFGWKLGGLPEGYDHKYIYSEVGYNLKATDLQAAIGVSQLSKLTRFTETRRANFNRIHARLSAEPAVTAKLELPRATEGTEPSWFGFPLRCLGKIERRKLVTQLEEAKVGTRLLFAGNITKQPAFENATMRVAEPLTNTDLVMNDVFWIGVHPGLTTEMIDYACDALIRIVKAI